MLGKTKEICTTAMGIALFVVLSLCLQVPIFENYYLCIGYIPMMLFCYFKGPIPGMAVGGLGVVLYCILTSGLRGMPGWFLGNLVIGLVVGIVCKMTTGVKNLYIRHLVIVVAIILANAIGILCIKSFVEVLLYAQPWEIRIAKNAYAFVADVIVLILSLPICVGVKQISYREI